MSNHSLFSPSSASRYMLCAPSVALTKDLPDTMTKDSAEGTLAHAMAELVLSSGKSALKPKEILTFKIERKIAEFLKLKIVETDPLLFDLTKDECVIEVNLTKEYLEMINAVNTYVSSIRYLSEGAEKIYYEEKMDLSIVMDSFSEKGTADTIAIFSDHVDVHDLKYGKGIQVLAKDNKQLMIYALGALEIAELLTDNIDYVNLYIHQPRLSKVDTWRTTPEALNQFKIDLQISIKKAHNFLSKEIDILNDCNAGDVQCRWCKVKSTCEAFIKHLTQDVIGDFEDETKDIGKAVADTITAIPNTDRNKIAKLYKSTPLFRSWLTALEDFVHAELLAGREIPGYKLVAGGGGNRFWKDINEAETLLKSSLRLKADDMYTKKLISPPAAEKLLKPNAKKWERVKPLIDKPGPKPTVAEITDKRKLWREEIAEEFEDLTEVPEDNSDLI